MTSDVIELDDPRPFRELEWIGIGKQYPKDAPSYIEDAKERVLMVPEQYKKYLPKPDIPVLQFLAANLPKISGELLAMKHTKWFSHDAPTTDPACLLTRPIPNANFLKGLENAIAQAWFDGSKSIVDPRYNDGHDRLPWWTITFWRAMSVIVSQQSTWKRSYLWLEQQRDSKTQDAETIRVAQQAIDLLSTIGWDSKLLYLRGEVSTALLPALLGRDWLSDEHVNMMMEELTKDLNKDETLKGKTVIAPLGLANELMSHGPKGTYQGAILHRYEKHIKDKAIEKLYFPAHINQNHWIAVYVDFIEGKIGYGDSLTGSRQQADATMKILRKWLKVKFDLDPQIEGNILPHGIQTDTFNCGPAMGNTIAHNVFGRELWTPANAVLERIRWFLRLSANLAVTGGAPASARSSPQPNSDSDSLLQDNIIASVALAEGDHNFPDLAEFIISTIKNNSQEDHAGVEKCTHGKMSISHLVNSQNDPPLEHYLERSTFSDLTPSLTEAPVAVDSDSDSGSNHSTDTSDRDSVSTGFSPDEMNVDVASQNSKKRTSKDSFFQRFESNASAAPDNTSNQARKLLSTKRPRSSDDLGDVQQNEKRSRDREVGVSKSARASKAKRESFKAGTLEISAKQLGDWKKEILSHDPHAEFDPSNIRRVRHSRCGKFLQVKEPLDLTRWRTHGKECASKEKVGKASNTKSLFSMGWAKSLKTPSGKGNSPETPQKMPCPGLSELDDARIPLYLRRTAAIGGGGRSIHTIATEMFKKVFSGLSKAEKEDVVQEQRHGHSWWNDHQQLKVFSTDCQKLVPGRIPNRPLPCTSCEKVRKSRGFRNVIKKPMPLPKNRAFVNKAWRNPVLGEIYGRVLGVEEIIEEPNAKKSPFVRYVKGVLSKKYNDEVFSGLLQAVMHKHDREERGVGMQNFKYTPAWDEFAHVLSIESPRAYRTLRAHFPAPAERSFRRREAKQPRFPHGITNANFELILNHLTKIGYEGTVSVSCDDTKLFSTFRLYWDGKEEAHFLIGGVNGPIKVLDPENMKELIASHKDKKAVKVRLWSLSLNVPKFTPFIIAALPIGNDMNAEQLAPLSQQILEGLITRKIRVVSYACDGTEVERAVERILTANAESCVEYVIKCPGSNFNDIELKIPVFKGQPVCMLQDSKHALKTMRNNLFSGARLLVLGNYTAMYSRIREMALEGDSPLYIRDVEKLDRQDDNAATRLFSAGTLQYIADKHPEYVGEIVYLFVFGELIDAYQNRSITHVERVKLVLRAKYFLSAWITSQEATKYAKAQYLVSREALDILQYIIDGYLSLVLIYRDHTDGISPLLPWLHSSEACEHIFGEARQIVKDFSFLDFTYMIPKLRVKMRQAIFSSKLSDPKARAAGYAHTYFDIAGLDELNLATFPSSDDISAAAEMAAEEANSLIRLLGLRPQQLRNVSREQVELPSIDSWFRDYSGPVSEDDEDNNDLWDNNGNDDEPSDAQQLQDLINGEEDISLSRTNAQDAELMNLSCAAFALTADEMTRIQTLVDEDVFEEEEIVAEEYLDLRAAASRIANLMVGDQPSKPLGLGTVTADELDFNTLVSMRRQHETRQAATGVRTQRRAESTKESEPRKTERQKLIRRFYETLKESQDDVAVGTGYERKGRWTSTAAKGGQVDGDASTAASGNTTNAIAAATTQAVKDAQKRRNIFAISKVPELEIIAMARITVNRALVEGDYVFIFVEDAIRVGQVLTMYSRGGGKNGKNGWVSTTSSITALSKVVVQVFEHSHGRQFSSKPTTTATLNVFQFAILPPSNVLTLLQSKPQNVNHAGFDLSPHDVVLFKKLDAGSSAFKQAMKTFRKRNVD